MIEFPKNFLWGAATSSYQVEGDNVNADWWPWEKEKGRESSGRACRHYEFYEADFDLAKGLHHNAHRLSVEWSRIEPEDGQWSRDALKHYVDVIRALRARNIEPVVTLHHFTNPVWFSKAGGWEDKRAVHRFVRYCETVVRALAADVRYWITINEPNVYASHAYILGKWPPQVTSYLRAKRVHDHMAAAHVEVFRRIQEVYKELHANPPATGIAQNLVAFVPCSGSLRNRLAAYLRNKVYNWEFLDTIARHQAMDFVGVNYYSRQLVDVEGWNIHHLATDVCRSNHQPLKKNFLGWDIYPEGLYDVLRALRKYHCPVIITENGICTPDDGLRWDFISSHLQNVHRALQGGVDVRGYFYWSLLDNFEWADGFGPRFGLIDVDYQSFRRTVRDSARRFGQVCQSGRLE